MVFDFILLFLKTESCYSFTSLSFALTVSVLLGPSRGGGFEISLCFLHLVASTKTVRVKTPPMAAYSTIPIQRQRQLAQQYHQPTVSGSHMGQENDQLDTHLSLQLVSLPSCSLRL